LNGKERIRKIEELSINAQPCLNTVLYDGWIMRFNNGYTKRGNSIQPLYSSVMDVMTKIQEVEGTYQGKELPIVFKMTDAAYPQNLDAILYEKGYKKLDVTSVQTLNLENRAFEKTKDVYIETSFTEEWLTNYCRLNNVGEQNHATLICMLQAILSKTCYVLLKEGSEVVACGLGVLQNNYLGLFDIVTNSLYRRKGYGEKLIGAILQWGQNNGAELAYLQVMLENKAACSLYQKLGFRESYQYWYRMKD
jgi:ribosomal protein S18 acetylase RimI-like enzyme